MGGRAYWAEDIRPVQQDPDGVVDVVALLVRTGGHVVLVVFDERGGVVVDGGRVVVGGGTQSGSCNATAAPAPTTALSPWLPAAWQLTRNNTSPLVSVGRGLPL